MVFVLPAYFFNGQNMTVTFYNRQGDPVGYSMAFLPLEPVAVDGVEVTSFSIEITWMTTDAACDAISWDVNLEVSSVTGDDPLNPKHTVWWTGVLWHLTVHDVAWDPDTLVGSGSVESPRYELDTFCSKIPEGTGFTMKFSGEYRFIDKNVDPYGQDPVYIGAFANQFVSATTTNFEYQANLDLPW